MNEFYIAVAGFGLGTSTLDTVGAIIFLGIIKIANIYASTPGTIPVNITIKSQMSRIKTGSISK